MVGVLVYSKTQSYGLKQQCLCSNKQSPFIVIQILSLHAYFSCTPLQSDIDKILNWTTVNLMSFNTSKCKQMIISRKKSQNVASALSLSGQVLELVNHYEYLGFYLSADLSWYYHIQCICAKARKIMGILYQQFSSNVDSLVMKRLHTSLVRPHLEYGVEV